MPTFHQLALNARPAKKKFKRNKNLEKCPQKKGVCVYIDTMSPRKPNSAKRRIARLRLSNMQGVFSHIPGIGHSLNKFSRVLVRGGRTKDLPGLKYKIIRGKFDAGPVKNRKTARSKYGVKISVQIRLNRRRKRS